MAKQGGKGGGSRKYGRQKRSPGFAAQVRRTSENKRAEILRANALQDRPDHAVSANCVAKRIKRERLREFKTVRKQANATERSLMGDFPSVRGEIQFGEKAKPWHLHQRENRLARALTRKEWDMLQRNKKEQKKAEASIETVKSNSA